MSQFYVILTVFAFPVAIFAFVAFVVAMSALAPKAWDWWQMTPNQRQAVKRQKSIAAYRRSLERVG